MMTGFDCRVARTDSDLRLVRELFREYQAWLNVDTCFQAFEEELETLPGAYGGPDGLLVLVTEQGSNKAAGCVGLQRSGDQACEIKRLYVRDPWRGQGLGRHLTELCLTEARKTGYQKIVLETVEFLTQARALYRSMGFRETASSGNPPQPRIITMEFSLK